MLLLEDADAEFHRRLLAAFGKESVLHAREDRAAYAFDAHRESMLPSAVVLPRTADEVALAIRIAALFEQPIIARGGGTSLTGSAAPTGGGLVVSLARMNRILSIDPRRRRARVQPGVITLELSYAAAPHHLFYAPDPASERVSTIGGNLATDAAGPHAFAYGSTGEQVLALEYVDGRGEIRSCSVERSGYDICGLLTGSEGTLGIVTALEVRLRRAPASIRVGLASFADIESAIEASTAIRERCSSVVALELIDGLTLTALNASMSSPYPQAAKAVILAEFAGLPEETRESEERAAILVERYASKGWYSAPSGVEAQRLWAGRRDVRRALARMSPDIAVHDLSLPRSRMIPMVRAVTSMQERFGLRVALVAHLGDGGVHPIVLYDRSDTREREAAFLLGNELLETAMSLGGGAGEYGIGMSRRALVYKKHDTADREALRRLHTAFDPDEILNPEKLLPFATSETR